MLREIEISTNAGTADTTGVREAWICSEVYQQLRSTFAELPYEVRQEAQFGRNSIDLLLAHEREDRNYAIEAKLAGSYSSRERLFSQLRRYRKKVPDLRRTYVLLVTERERDLPANKNSVAHVVDEAEGEPKTEVIVVGPGSLAY